MPSPIPPLMRFLMHGAVTLAVIATLLFNASYGWTRGATLPEQAALVLVAVIIDLGKSTFLAGAAHLHAHGHPGRGLLLVVLWVPCFVFSTFAGYAFIASNRAETAVTKTTTVDNRTRLQARYDDARAQLKRITEGATFAVTAGCSQTKTKEQRTACAAYSTAQRELTTATAALATSKSTAAANPETRLLASATGLAPETAELLVAFLPALLLELIASLGVYAVARPGTTTVAVQSPRQGPETAPEAVVGPRDEVRSPAPAKPTPTPAYVPGSVPTVRIKLAPAAEPSR